MTDSQLLLNQLIPIESYKPRLYLNGFPKSGLHMLEMFAWPLISASKNGRYGSEWLGTFKWNSFSNEWLDIRGFTWRLGCLERGNYLKGHCGYDKTIQDFMYYSNIGQIFVYRDPRDVAVSLAHHILSDDPQLRHEHKDLYRAMGDFPIVLAAVIGGLGPYPGIISRWVNYANWLNVDWVLKLKYEDMVRDKKATAKKILLYSIHNATHLLECIVGEILPTRDTEDNLVNDMISKVDETHLSVTFRKGAIGEWKKHFSDEHIELWKKHDPDNWITKLGYEAKENW